MKGDDDSEEEDTLSLYCLLIVVLDVSRIVDGRLFVSSLKRSIESSICRQGATATQKRRQGSFALAPMTYRAHMCTLPIFHFFGGKRYCAHMCTITGIST